MRFSVVTASFRQLSWLKRCIRSVADQDVPLEHLIQDGGTGPELDQWVREHSGASLQVAPDRGMYDALNHGFARARGEVFSLLNCDEQYLPGTLQKVKRAFAENPQADMVVGDCLIIDPAGELLTYRRSTPLRRAMILTDHLYDYTCAMFFRRELWAQAGEFSLDYRAISDADWVVRALATRPRIVYLREYLSVFTLTGENLSETGGGVGEAERLKAQAPAWMRRAAPAFRALRHLEKLVRGGYSSGPIEYAIYSTEEAPERRTFRCEKPSSKHPWA